MTANTYPVKISGSKFKVVRYFEAGYPTNGDYICIGYVIKPTPSTAALLGEYKKTLPCRIVHYMSIPQHANKHHIMLLAALHLYSQEIELGFESASEALRFKLAV